MEMRRTMVEPYINLKGKTSEAMDFYEDVFDAQDKSVTLLGDMPDMMVPDGVRDRVAYGHMTICGTNFNFTDMEYEELASSSMISFMVKFDDEEDMKRAYRRLANGGRVMMELAPMLHARQFAWVKDKYGIDWQLLCE